MSIKVFAALAALLLATPAFARGDGGNDRGGSRGQPSHQSSAPNSSSSHGSRPSSHVSSSSSHNSRSATHGSVRATNTHHRESVSSHSRRGHAAPAHTQHHDSCGHRWQSTYWNGHSWIPGLWISLGF